MTSFFAATLLALLLPQEPANPESTPQGRTHFLGRAIAQTMHWQGAPWLLRQTREHEENGIRLRQWLDVQPGQSVCDLGCGNGYHTLPLAKAVGSTGKAFAVDVQPQMLGLLRQRAKADHLDNLVLVEAALDDPRLPPASCDLVLLVDVYHELSHPVAVMQRVRQALKPAGRVVLVEFRAEDPDVPIKPEHKMTKAQIVREMAMHGFVQTGAFDDLPWQHAMEFEPEASVDPRSQARQVLRGFLASLDSGNPASIAPWLQARLTAADLPALPDQVRAELRAGNAGELLASLDTAGGARSSDEVVLGSDAEGRWFVRAMRPTAPVVRAHGAAWPLVAMHTGTGGGRVQDQTGLVHELGFDGLALDLHDLAAARVACETVGNDLFSAWAVLDLGVKGGPDLAPLRTALQTLRGGPGMLWLALRHASATHRDPAGDADARAALRELLVHADATGVEIALYPHHGFWLETVEDALRLCAQVDQPRLGVCFNLCHFLRTSDAIDPQSVLTQCGDRLLAVTINGADVKGADWRTLIQPLGEGDFALAPFLAALEAIGFQGPIGLQGYGIERPAREHLAASMRAWRAAAGR